MNEGIHTRVAPTAPFRDPALDPRQSWFNLGAIIIATVLATSVAGLLMIALNHAAHGSKRLSWGLRIAALALVAPFVVSFSHVLLVLSYNHDSSFTWIDLTISMLIQAMIVGALAYWLQGEELSARYRARLPIRSWLASAGLIAGVWAALMLWFLLLALGLRAIAGG
ncbi:hypothetical protein [Lysobacter capsici]|uniref:hypothetical protein n=1 Tax=Lysobacter capsici TaxID=435897 RepID=UPI0006280B5F|nr:hypothetical protein [Lysobacter capsici]